MDVLVEGAGDARDGARAELIGEGFEGGELEEALDLVDGFAMGGLGDAEAVPGEGGVAVVVDGRADVAVVVVVDGEVPVTPIKADAVGQDL